MILADSFNKEWIYSHREKKGFEKINPPLVEKMIHALALVEALAASGMDFIFKGGTSLILLMDSPGRFSIDDNLIPVKMPTVESITGDKLTAFAPNTTGVLYNRGKELEIIKQLFDLGRLFHKVQSLEIVSTAFDNTVEKEIAYRNRSCKRGDVLNDIVQTGLLIAKREQNKEYPHLSNFKEIKKGLLQFKQYQMSSFFRIDEAIVASSKAAYMASKIKSGNYDALEIFQPGRNKQDFWIQNTEYNFLNKLKAEALFYWFKSLEAMSLL